MSPPRPEAVVDPTCVCVCVCVYRERERERERERDIVLQTRHACMHIYTDRYYITLDYIICSKVNTDVLELQIIIVSSSIVTQRFSLV
jgi:hypothetical protein